MIDNKNNANIGEWVIYKNNQLIAFNKPAGIPTQPDLTEDKSLQDLGEIYAKAPLHVIHRLDRTASGVVLMAKNGAALAHLNEQFKERAIGKTYLAVVGNRPPKTEDTLVHFLHKDGKKNTSKAYTEEQPNTLKAEMHYEVIAESDKYFLLKINLLTGRHHQIRSQLAAIGCPIKGDVKYGARRSNTDRSVHLHAWKLSFRHPVSHEKVELTAPLPNESLWQFFEEKLG